MLVPLGEMLLLRRGMNSKSGCFFGVYGFCRLTIIRYDKVHNIRKDLVEALKKEFPDYGLT